MIGPKLTLNTLRLRSRWSPGDVDWLVFLLTVVIVLTEQVRSRLMWSALPDCSLCLTSALSFRPASLALSRDCNNNGRKHTVRGKASHIPKCAMSVSYSVQIRGRGRLTNCRSPRPCARQLSSIRSFTFFSRIFTFSSGLKTNRPNLHYPTES